MDGSLVITGNDSLFIAGGQTEDDEVVSHAYTYTMGDASWTQAWLPDGYSPFLDCIHFGPSGLNDYGSATLRCKI